jgi:hypothetical protein
MCVSRHKTICDVCPPENAAVGICTNGFFFFKQCQNRIVMTLLSLDGRDDKTLTPCPPGVFQHITFGSSVEMDQLHIIIAGYAIQLTTVVPLQEFNDITVTVVLGQVDRKEAIVLPTQIRAGVVV